MDNPFSKFESFGAIANKETRAKLAKAIFDEIQKTSEGKISLSNTETANFSEAINQILANQTMRELCKQDPELAEKVTLEILDFVNKAKRAINISDDPFSSERQHLTQFNEVSKEQFPVKWGLYAKLLKSIYKPTEIDTSFYSKEFTESLAQKKEEKNKQSFESVKEHLSDKWTALLFKKQSSHELSIIDQWRKKFCEELYKRIEELKNLQDALEPFTKELGRLWDMSKGTWQRVNFDLLKQYANLLKKDKALAELAEMLGRMQQAEKDLEEELFTNTVIKTEWVVEYAHKADLVGVRESDDLSSMLPSETAFLSDPVLQTIFFKKFAEKKLQTFEYQSKSLAYREEEFEDKRLKAKENEKGPFIICVDTSGSMHGTPETVAKTLCFAILKIALQENRKCYLISFSTGIETLNLTDLKNSLEKLLQFLAMSFYGGTDATPAVKEALRQLQTQDYKQADVLMISDFVMSNFNDHTKQQIQKAKENKTKFHSLVIGSSQNKSVIADFDNNWIYDPNNRNSVITLVKNLYQLNK